jgi:hypothetical protein
VSCHHLAQLNIVKMKFAIDDPRTPGSFERIEFLRRQGPRPSAFTFKQAFDPQ